MRVRHANGAGGWCPEDGEVFFELDYPHSERTISEADWRRLQDLLGDFDFWNRPSEDAFPPGSIRFHGTHSVLEVATRGRYGFVSRGMGSLEADEPSYSEICSLLTSMAELTPVGPYSSC